MIEPRQKGAKSMIKSNIGKCIRSMRQQAGFTQQEIADKMQVSRGTISSWEVNRTEPSINDVERLAHYFGCSKSELLGDYKNAMALDEYMDDPYLRDFILFAGANRPHEHLEEFYAALKQMYSALLNMRH